jgi:hypothetical protein
LPKNVRDKDIKNIPLILRGDKMLVVVPETADLTIPKFSSLVSFPLSKGRPMLILEDSESFTRYYIPLESISGMVTSSRDRRSE